MTNTLPWQPGGARGGNIAALKNGGQYLAVVRLAGRLFGGNPFWDWHVLYVKQDEQGAVTLHSNDWVWTWDDVSWVLPIECLTLPGE